MQARPGEMMRIIAGKFRSRHLKSPKNLSLRPTSDRLRETLFDILGDRIAGSRFLDLFAGTGAIGIEAISRGAAFAAFVENHGPTVKLIRANLAALEITLGARILAVDSLAALATLAREKMQPFDLIYLDPPYAQQTQYQIVLDALGSSPLVGAHTLVIVEHRKSLRLPSAVGTLHSVREKLQGDSALTFFRKVSG